MKVYEPKRGTKSNPHNISMDNGSTYYHRQKSKDYSIKRKDEDFQNNNKNQQNLLLPSDFNNVKSQTSVKKVKDFTIIQPSNIFKKKCFIPPKNIFRPNKLNKKKQITSNNPKTNSQIEKIIEANMTYNNKNPNNNNRNINNSICVNNINIYINEIEKNNNDKIERNEQNINKNRRTKINDHYQKSFSCSRRKKCDNNINNSMICSQNAVFIKKRVQGCLRTYFSLNRTDMELEDNENNKKLMNLNNSFQGVESMNINNTMNEEDDDDEDNNNNENRIKINRKKKLNNDIITNNLEPIMINDDTTTNSNTNNTNIENNNNNSTIKRKQRANTMIDNPKMNNFTRDEDIKHSKISLSKNAKVNQIEKLSKKKDDDFLDNNNNTNYYNPRTSREDKNDIDEDDNNKMPLDLEDFLLIIQKFEIIKISLNSFVHNNSKLTSKQLLESINSIRIKIYDLYIFYMSCSFEGNPQNLFAARATKYFLNYYSIVFLICLGLFYIITHKIKMTIDYQEKLINLLNMQEKAFLDLSDLVSQKLKMNSIDNANAGQIIKDLRKKMGSNTNNNNLILQIKILTNDSYKIINDILNNWCSYSNNKNSNNNNNNEQEFFMYKQFHNKDIHYLTQLKINEIEEMFDKNIFKAINLRSNYANITSLKRSINNNEPYFNNINYNTNNNNNNINSNSVNRKGNKIKSLNNRDNAINNWYFHSNSNNNNYYYNKVNFRIREPYLDFPPQKEYTLVLDLDETMISFKFVEFNQGIGKMHLRPGLEEFLEVIRDYYEIIVFTSGTRDYADTVLDVLEQKKNTTYFSGRLYREHTIPFGKKFIKDLSKIGRDLSRTIIVDNLPQSFKFQHENGILISSFYGDNMDDKALYELQRILINIYHERTDVRTALQKYKEDIMKNVTCIDENVYNMNYC